MVDCRPHHQRRRRAGGGDRKSRESNPPSCAGCRAALCLATGAAPMVDFPECAGAGGVGCRRLFSVVRRFACFGICRARGVAAWRCTWPAGDPGTRAFSRSARRAPPARGLVLGRQPPAAFGIVAGLRSEEHTSELQSLAYLVCRLLLEKKKKKQTSKKTNIKIKTKKHTQRI